MARGTEFNVQWQTARANIIAADTPLTNYKPSDLTQTVKDKMFAIHPATAIILRAFGTGAGGNSNNIVISGWMKSATIKSGAGPGHRLWEGAVVLGTKSLAGDLPSNDKRWPAGTWLEADTWTLSSDPAGATILVRAANKEMIFILPTYGYTDILIEVGTLVAANLGFLWRPARVGEVMKTF